MSGQSGQRGPPLEHRPRNGPAASIVRHEMITDVDTVTANSLNVANQLHDLAPRPPRIDTHAEPHYNTLTTPAFAACLAVSGR